MKKVSTLSHAKAVHAVKSIGKVLLPVALLLAAILCIGVCAGAEDTTDASVTYTYYSESMHIKIENGTPVFEKHQLSGPECSTSGICKKCGYVGTKVSDDSKHEWANVIADTYLKEKKSCAATNVYYRSCQYCGKLSNEEKNTFVGSAAGATHSYTKQGSLIEKTGACNQLKQYRGKCACGEESKSVVITGTVTYGHKNVQNFNGSLTAEMISAKIAVSDLAVNGSLCGLATEYYDFCADCGDVLTSKTAYTADSAENLATLIEAIHTSNTTYVVKSYNDNAHWTVCTACNTIVESAKHTYSVADKKVDCAHPQKCECGYEAKSVAHKYVYHAAVDATCDANGNKAYYTCSECNGVFDSERNATTLDALTVAATGHKQADSKAPLCNPGVCSVCGKEIEASAEHGHEWKAVKHKKMVNGVLTEVEETNCTSVCKNCGKVKGKHTYAAKQTEGKSACEKGYATWNECLTCGDVQNYVENKNTSHVYPALGTYPCEAQIKCEACGQNFKSHHKVADNFEYDCTQPLNVVCVNCKNVFTEAKTTYNTGHSNVWVAAVAATCTTDGTTSGYKCQHSITIYKGTEFEQTFECKAGGDVQTVKKTGHTWGEYQVTREATCVISGQKNRQCTVCKAWDTVVDTGVDATAHKWSSDYRTTGDGNSHYHYCINISLEGKQCGEAATAETHTYYVTVDGKQVEVKAKAADCRGAAKCVCGATLEVGACKNETKYDSANHWNVCKVCGKVTGKTTHTIVTINAKDATCAEAGYASHLGCSECDYAPQAFETYPATGEHTWSAWGYADKAYEKGKTVKNTAKNAQNTYHYRKCTTCGDIDSHKSVSDNAANCIYPNRCTTCELTILKSKNSDGTCNDVEKAALGHDLAGVTTVVTESTHSVTCKRCNATIVEAHKLPEGAAACVDNKCAVCDYVIKATGEHKAAENTTMVVTTSGHGFECTGCGKTITEAHIYNIEVIDCTADIKCTVCEFVVASGYKSHDVDFISGMVEAVAPTCTTAGHSAGFKCTRCNYVYGGTTLPATGHSFQIVPAKAATATEDGYTQHFACSVCGATEGKEVLPKTGDVLKGDFNADGKVTSDDAIALLKSILFGGDANQSKDFNGDGKVDSADAIALLKAALFG